MSRQELRKSALRRYIVFRVKAIEFLDLLALRQSLRDPQLANMNVPLPSFPSGRPAVFVSDSIRTVILSWFCVFIDKSKDGMDVIKLWSTMFPDHADRIEAAWKRIEPAWEVLREFRDRAGFHADKPVKFFGARRRLRSEWRPLEAALLEFEKLFKFLLSVEAKELPDLEEALDGLLDELEKAHGAPYKREQFKAYLMIPDTRTTNPKTIAKSASQ
jgi:hypothetical protein